MDKKPQMMTICKKGHTIPLSNNKCRDTQCRNFTTDESGNCKYSVVVVEPSPAKDKVLAGTRRCRKYGYSKASKCIQAISPINGCADCPEWQLVEPSPEPMPLIDQELLTTIKGHITFQCVCGNGKCAACENTSRDIMHSIQAWLPAHDQQVRKDFAKECIKGMHILRNPYNPRIGNDHVRFDNTCAKQLKADIAHLRAMAGER